MSDSQQPTKMWSGRFRQLCMTMTAVVLVLPSFFGSPNANAQAICPFDANGNFTVYTDIVALPTGYFLLVRNGDKIGAIRVISVTKEVKTPPKVGEWIGQFTYESYYNHGNTALLDQQSSIHATGVLTYKRMVGFSFHTSHQPGNHFSRIGPWKFLFSPEREVSISDFNWWSGIGERGFEVAPTSACDVSQIDAHNSRLHWYRIDPNREPVEIPISALPHRLPPDSDRRGP